MFRRLLLSRNMPEWMQSDHPIIKREIAREKKHRKLYNLWLKLLRWLSIALMVLFLIGIGQGTYNVVTPHNTPSSFSQAIFTRQLFPLYFIHFLLFAGALMLGIDTISDQKRANSWDTVRSTSRGIHLIIWGRWAYLTFYHNSTLLKISYLVRLLLMIGLLMDLTAFGGNYLSYLLLQSTPAVPLWLGVILLGIHITAGLLFPLTMLSLTSAIGLLLSTYFKQQILSLLAKIVFVISYILISLFSLMLLSTIYFESASQSSNVLANNAIGIEGVVIAILTTIFADWGTNLLFLGFLGEQLWVNIEYGIFIGVGMLGVVLAQAFLSEVILRYAVRRADQSH